MKLTLVHDNGMTSDEREVEYIDGEMVAPVERRKPIGSGAGPTQPNEPVIPMPTDPITPSLVDPLTVPGIGLKQ